MSVWIEEISMPQLKGKDFMNTLMKKPCPTPGWMAAVTQTKRQQP
ncbi:MAG: hypothetical protein ABF381_07855 [Akkermansiaceae bacterium]